MVVLPIFLFFLGWVRCQYGDNPCVTDGESWSEYNTYCYDPCKAFPSWVQRDKCYCDMGTDTSRCDVYCKQPYLDNSVCAEKSSGNDKWRCLYLNIKAACINYCNSTSEIAYEDCICTYVEPDPLCPNYCNTGTTLDDERKLECGCKYHSDDSTSITEDCYNYCNKEMHADTWEAYLKCQCTYLSNSSACQALCKAAGNDEFSQRECLCLLDKKKGLNVTSPTCLDLSTLVEDIKVPDAVYIPKIPSDHGYDPAKNPEDFNLSLCADPSIYNCSEPEEEAWKSNKKNREKKIVEDRAWWYLKDKIDRANGVTNDAYNVSECYYGENIDVCRNYCDSLNDINQTDSCKCTKMNDKESCAEVCRHEIANEDFMLECQCMIDPMYCEQYCYKHFAKDPSKDITKNKEFQECNCTLSSGEEGTETNPSCGLFCEMVFNPANNATEEEKAKRTGLCENFCMAKTSEADPDGQSICRCKTLHDYSGCEPFCKMLNGTRSDENIENCRRYCHSLGWAEDTTDCLCTHKVDGHFCRDYCIREDGFSLTFCETYCNALDTSQSLKCRCSYLDGSKCIDYCNYFGLTACNDTLGGNVTFEDLEVVGEDWKKNPKLQKCLEEVPEVLNCYCSFGVGLSDKRDDLYGACAKECDALGKTGRVVERARCVCRYQINVTACADYCDMSLAGHANSRHLRDKCKCDYEQGDEYCKAYSRSLPHENHLKYECTVRGDKSACYDYCLNYVSPLGNEIETYKCWCEMYGDLIWCPVYCDSLRPSDYKEATEKEQKRIFEEWNRCKCFHYDDKPSCQQYCPLIDNATQKIECECLILNDKAGCKVYCESLPTYGERIVCACVHEVDPARCIEIATLKIGALKEKEPPRSELIRPRCDNNVTKGQEFVKACRNYCIAVQEEAAPGILEELKKKNLTVRRSEGFTEEQIELQAQLYIKQKTRGVSDMCMCDIGKSIPACKRYCTEQFPILTEGSPEDINVSLGYYARCLCQHLKETTECKRSCDLIYKPNDEKFKDLPVKMHKRNALNTECMCNLTENFGPDSADYADALTYCGTSCELRYGIKNSVKFYSCFVQYDRKKEHNHTFCETFFEAEMKKFCHCFYNQNNTDMCKDTCSGRSNEPKGLPKLDMCLCFINDTSKCSVFCEKEILSRRDCNNSCAYIADDESKAMQYANCLCNGIGSASACRTVCDQYYFTDKKEYHFCRCERKLGTLSCQHWCEGKYGKSDDYFSAYQGCIRDFVNITIGVVEGKERYLSNYDVDDVYEFNDIPEVWVREVEEKEEEEEEKEVEEEKEEEEEEKKEVEEEKEEEEEEEEEAVQELKKEEEVLDEPVTKQGWLTNKTNMLLMIMASSVFAVAVVAAIIVVIAVYRLGNSSAAGDGEKSTTMFEMGEENPTEKAETSLDPSNEFAEEQKKAPGEEMDLNVDE